MEVKEGLRNCSGLEETGHMITRDSAWSGLNSLVINGQNLRGISGLVIYHC